MTDGRRTDTSGRILDAALALMSERGYAGVSVRDIADAVGIKAASLYKHFADKRAVFDATVAREVAHVEKTLHDVGAVALPQDDPGAYAEADDARLTELVWNSYAPFFEDARIRMLRRMLELSRYADERCAALYKAIFVDRPLELQRAIYAHLIECGRFCDCDTWLAAQQFHGPMLMMIGVEASPEDARAFCHKHLEAFNAQHRRGIR